MHAEKNRYLFSLLFKFNALVEVHLQNGQASDLDGIAEERANVLEIVSERLSKHVLANYDMFVEGINEAASVEADLQVFLSHQALCKLEAKNFAKCLSVWEAQSLIGWFIQNPWCPYLLIPFSVMHRLWQYLVSLEREAVEGHFVFNLK